MNNQEHIDIPQKVRDKKIIPEESAQAGLETLSNLMENTHIVLLRMLARDKALESENSRLKTEIKHLKSRR